MNDGFEVVKRGRRIGRVSEPTEVDRKLYTLGQNLFSFSIVEIWG